MTRQLELFLPGWDIEPCDTAEPPPSQPRPRTAAADGLRRLRERRVEPEAGRAATGRRLWTPGGDDIHITTIRPESRFL